MSTIEKKFGVENTMAGVLSNSKDVVRSNKEYYKGSKTEMENPKVEEFARKILPSMNSLYGQLTRDHKAIEFLYSYGYPYVGDENKFYKEAIETAEQSDVIILTVGDKYGTGSTASSGEGIDSTSINLPLCQERFIEKVQILKKPIIIIHFGGRPISSDAADKYADAILEVWNPGEYGSEAISQVLFGDYNPGGRMPVTTAYSAGQIPIYYNHLNGSSYHQGTGGAYSGYVDCPHEPRYFFGHGLSYTTFVYENLQVVNKSNKSERNLLISLDVTNVGNYDGDEVVQLYVRDLRASMVRPNIEMAGFIRTHLKKDEKKRIVFNLNTSQLSFLDENMQWKIEAGDFELLVGSSVKDIRLKTIFRIKESYFINGKERELYCLGSEG